MNTEILGVVAQIALMVILAYPLGRYIAKVYKGEKTWSDFMAPIERVIYKVCGIDPKEEMNWKQFLKALLILNAFWFVWGMVLLVSQGWLPLNRMATVPKRRIRLLIPVSVLWSTVTCSTIVAKAD